MKVFNLKDMKRGWFVGNFEPSIIKTDKCEIAVKKYKKGEREDAHYHLLTDEITVIVSGKVKMKNREFGEDDIILIPRGAATDFVCLEDAVTVVYKNISAKNDKYILVEDKWQMDFSASRQDE